MKNAVIWRIWVCLTVITTAGTTSVMAQPANDNCANAILLTPGVDMAGTTILATTDPGFAFGCSGTGYAESVWYSFIGTGNPMYLSTCNTGTDFDTEISVLTQPVGTPEGFSICDFHTCVAGNDNGPGISNPGCYNLLGQNVFSVIDEFATIDGQEYLVRISTGSVTGTGNFNLEFGELISAPVSLMNFWGEPYEQGNSLVWETASESNVLWHIIEHSPNGISDWREVGRLVSETAAAQGAFYELIDTDPFSNTYYRLKTVDYDDSEQLSEVISIKRSRPEFDVTNVYPNPVFEGEVTIQIESERNQEVNIRIMDLAGKEIDRFEYQVRDGLNEMQVDTDDWRSGVYFIQFASRQGYTTKKIFKQE